MQATLHICPTVSYTTIQLQPLVLCNLLPALPQIPSSSLSPIPLIWPLCSWFQSVSSRSWANQQICQEMQEGNRGLSECAGYLRGCSPETLSVSSTSYSKPETSRGWAWVPQGQMSCGYEWKMRTLKAVVESPWSQKEVPEIEKHGRKVSFLVCVWGLWISFLGKEELPGILRPVLYPEGNYLALDSAHTWDFILQ